MRTVQVGSHHGPPLLLLDVPVALEDDGASEEEDAINEDEEPAVELATSDDEDKATLVPDDTSWELEAPTDEEGALVEDPPAEEVVGRPEEDVA